MDGHVEETAHQLGHSDIIPLMAWVDILKMKGVRRRDSKARLEKDTERLQIIADRFSKIGSISTNKEDNVVDIVEGIVDYMRVRDFQVRYKSVSNTKQSISIVPINKSLFEWLSRIYAEMPG